MADDIAEKVGDLLFDQGVKLVGSFVSFVPKIIKGVGSFGSESIDRRIDEFNKNKNLRQLLGLEGEISAEQMDVVLQKLGQKSSSIHIANSDVADYEKLLKEQGVLFAKIDRKDDDCTAFVFLNRDIEKAEKASQILRANRGRITELRSDLYFNSLSPDKVHVIQGLTPEETELFRYYAREQQLLFTAIDKKDNTMIVCNAEDKQKARKALLYTGWALTSAEGARIREQIQHRLAGRSAIQISAEEGERELYIVSGINPSNYVKISSEDYALYKYSKQVGTVSRSDPDFFGRCMAACDSLAHPVVLSPAQFREDLTPQELQNAYTIDMFPSGYDSEIEMDHVNRLADLVARKSGLDNEGNSTWGIYDTSVSYSEFASYENIADEDEREGREYEFEHFKKAAYYSQDHHFSEDIDMEEKDLDYIIAKAEDKRRSMYGEDERQQPQQNFSNRAKHTPERSDDSEPSRE